MNGTLAIIICFATSIFCFLDVSVPRMKCNREIMAMYVGYRSYSSRGGTAYYPVYTYEYNGQMYTRQSHTVMDSNGRYLFVNGSWHRIWINENRPGYCIFSKDLKGFDVLLIITGVVFLLLTIGGLLCCFI